MNEKIAHFINKLARQVYKITDLCAINYWHNFPFEKYKETYSRLWEEVKAQQYPRAVKGVDEECEKCGYTKTITGARDDLSYVIVQKQA